MGRSACPKTPRLPIRNKVKTPLYLVHDEVSDAGEQGIVDQHLQEQARGHEQDVSLCRVLRVKSDIVSDLGTKAGPPFIRHPLGHRDGGEPAGLGAHDVAGLARCVGLLGDKLRDLGGLATSRLPRQHQHLRGVDCSLERTCQQLVL